MKQEECKEEVYLTPSEISSFLGIPLNHIYNLLKSGELKGYRIGIQWRIADSDFKAFMQARRYQPSQESGIHEI